MARGVGAVGAVVFAVAHCLLSRADFTVHDDDDIASQSAVWHETDETHETHETDETQVARESGEAQWRIWGLIAGLAHMTH